MKYSIGLLTREIKYIKKLIIKENRDVLKGRRVPSGLISIYEENIRDLEQALKILSGETVKRRKVCDHHFVPTSEFSVSCMKCGHDIAWYNNKPE